MITQELLTTMIMFITMYMETSHNGWKDCSRYAGTQWLNTFTSSMNDALYSWNNGTYTVRISGVDDAVPPTTSSIQFDTRVANTAALNDANYNCMSIRGDLA